VEASFIFRRFFASPSQFVPPRSRPFNCYTNGFSRSESMRSLKKCLFTSLHKSRSAVLVIHLKSPRRDLSNNVWQNWNSTCGPHCFEIMANTKMKIRCSENSE
jgi:hypothetical protein